MRQLLPKRVLPEERMSRQEVQSNGKKPQPELPWVAIFPSQ